jgi:uncharacterized protein (TIGR00369 family)
MTGPASPAKHHLPLPLHLSPQALALGLAFVSQGPEGATMTVAFRSDLVGDPDTGVIAGGVVTTLLDHTCGYAVVLALGRPAAIATLDLRIDYMRAAEPGRSVYALAQCYKLTRAFAFVRATAYDRDLGDPIAMAQAVFMIPEASPSVGSEDAT